MIELIHSLLHIDVALLNWAQEYGNLLYIILFLIIFAETGLVFCPFLPGVSLLFAVGALAANPLFMKIEIIIPLLIIAAVTGDTTNYFVGRKLGRSLFEKDRFFLRKKYLISTEEFFREKGVWAVSLSRFFPIIRTMSPFFAGMSLIPYARFLTLSIIGSVGWVFIFCMAGFYFGQVEIIKKNFTLLVLGIIVVSLIPLAISFLKTLKKTNRI